MSDLPAFPVDDATLLAIEHSLDAALTFERPESADLDDEGPWLAGADYSLARLLDFLAGTTGDDPDAEVLDPGDLWTDDARVVFDSRTHYSEHDLIRALVTEVRRLRDEVSP